MKYYPCLWAKGWQYKCVILVSLFKIQNQFTRKMVEIKNVFPNELWKFKWKRYWESKPIVSPVAFSDDQAAGRDQAWPSVWKGLYPQPGGKFQWEKQMPPIWLSSVENTEGMPERPVKWRFTLLWNVYSHSRFVLSTNHLRCPWGLKKQYFNLYLLHISALSSFRVCFPFLEDLFQFLCSSISSNPVCVCVCFWGVVMCTIPLRENCDLLRFWLDSCGIWEGGGCKPVSGFGRSQKAVVGAQLLWQATARGLREAWCRNTLSPPTSHVREGQRLKEETPEEWEAGSASPSSALGRESIRRTPLLRLAVSQCSSLPEISMNAWPPSP